MRPRTPKRRPLARINRTSASVQLPHAKEKQNLGVLQDDIGSSKMQKLHLETISPTPPAQDDQESSPLQLVTTRDGEAVSFMRT